MNRTRLLLLTGIVVALGLFFTLDLQQYLTFSFFQTLYQDNPGMTLGIFFAIYVAVTALSLPGAAVLTLVGGAIFGLWTGLLVISFASTIGATLAFLISRTLLKDFVQRKFGGYLKTINEGVERDGSFYLATLRLIPAVPFFVINLAMGLTPMRAVTFYGISQLAMLPGTFVYVNAGAELGEITDLSLSGILSPTLLLSFVLLGLFPWIAKAAMGAIQARRAMKGFNKPAKFDYNLAVIGAGSGGLVSAYIARAVKAKVALIEKHKMGGDCLNTGCVPSKALIRSARISEYIRRADAFGLDNASADINFRKVMERIQKVIAKVEPHDSVERFTGLGAECLQGTAKLKSPWEVDVDGKTITARNVIIATGGRPVMPDIPGLDQVKAYNSDTIWELRERPEKLLVIGGGPIGSELAQSFSRLGCQVTQLDRGQRLLHREDPDVSEAVMNRFKAEGIQLCLEANPVAFHNDGEKQWLEADQNGEIVTLPFDAVLIAAGRRPNTENIGLEALGIETNPNGTIKVDDYLRTTMPNIFACGDVAGPYQFTHTASHQAWYASVNALFGKFKKFKADYSVIPWCTFTDPEVARVGLNEQEAQEQGIEYEVTRYGIDDLDRAIADEEDHGFVKVLTRPGSDKILGVTIVGYHAGELIAEYVSAMKHGLGMNKILGTIHIYPTLSEANKFAAGEWKKANAPQNLLKWVERFHGWMR
ncbi:FAD-dependent oxidoreductase [Spongorhabdus nitratireducens]